MRHLTTALLTCALFSGAVHASSPEAWNEHRKQVIKTCLAASQLKDAHARSKPVEFDDQVGYSALLIEGRYPQAHMKGRTGTELCLYDKQHQRAHVSEWAAASR
ncbi:hypothetical protein PS627_04196 [Pseudomonas fluorescens]|uniref:hypothetical protein n=1 Tax=Pseudomonas fluorescens TaxID=294 RepID=UPI0012585A13|nr:hypothetical protein [Pseudomonas fluorescens]CAG8870892.1 hypothetical protein PS627_04196 [Pseudomonas fluorescens]